MGRRLEREKRWISAVSSTAPLFAVGPNVAFESLADRLSLFRQPREKRDILPREAARRLLDLDHLRRESEREAEARSEAGGQPHGPLARAGALLLDESRLALEKAGDQAGVSLFAIPTANGWVYWWGTTLGGGLAPTLLEGGLVWGQQGARYRDGSTSVAVHGLVADEVVGVALVIRKVACPATVGRNAFLGEYRDNRQINVHALRLTYRDGTARDVAFP